MMNTFPAFHDVKQAAERIRPFIHHPPVLRCQSLDKKVGAEFFFKCENFQKVGAFKYRGACNAVFSLSEAEAKKGVATHSSGNHAQALALAARNRNIPAYIVMPENAPRVKIEAVESYGGKITFCKATQEARKSTLAALVEEKQAIFIPSFNDPRIIAGQGTAALEFLTESPFLDILMTPVGGGGLLSGTALVAAEISPKTKVIAAEPANADDAYRSLKVGKILPSNNPKTIADGLKTSLGDYTFPIIQKLVTEIVLAQEETIVEAMLWIWQRMKILIEPSAAVPLAAIFEDQEKFSGKKIGIILSGGNVDFQHFPWSSYA